MEEGVAISAAMKTASGRRKAFLSLPLLCLFSLTHTAAALQKSGNYGGEWKNLFSVTVLAGTSEMMIFTTITIVKSHFDSNN